MKQMTTVMTSLKKYQDDFLQGAERVEEPIVRYTGEFAERVAPYVPERPEWAFLAKVPTVSELVDFQLKFTKRVVDHQVVFVRKMLKAMEPALVKIDAKKAPNATKTTAARTTTARKTTARKTTARKAA
jgi:hypothetical protein